MKTKLLFPSLLIFIIITGCNKNFDTAFTSAEENLKVDNTFDFCNSKEAVFKSYSKYDTNLGQAILHIPIPRGHFIKQVGQSKNSVSFVTVGNNDFNGQFVTERILVSNLSTTSGDKLKVNLKISPSAIDRCGPRTKGEKKKTSTIDGVPFDGGLLK